MGEYGMASTILLISAEWHRETQEEEQNGLCFIKHGPNFGGSDVRVCGREGIRKRFFSSSWQGRRVEDAMGCIRNRRFVKAGMDDLRKENEV
jgi:hypothetical protein